MNNIYAIRNDGIKFLDLDLEILDVTRNAPDSIDEDDIIDFSLNNTAMKSWWKTPETKFMNVDGEGEPNSPIPDVSIWIDASLVLTPKAYRLLGDLLKSSGEFLPVSAGDETYYIFNCFVFGEEDENKSKYEVVDGNVFGLESLVFKESASELLAFKSKLQSCLTLFCNEQFKEAVESFELSGIVFDSNLMEVFD